MIAIQSVFSNHAAMMAFTALTALPPKSSTGTFEALAILFPMITQSQKECPDGYRPSAKRSSHFVLQNHSESHDMFCVKKMRNTPIPVLQKLSSIIAAHVHIRRPEHDPLISFRVPSWPSLPCRFLRPSSSACPSLALPSAPAQSPKLQSPSPPLRPNESRKRTQRPRPEY